MRDAATLKRVDPRYTDERFGLPTVRDILASSRSRAATRAPSSAPRPSARASRSWRSSTPGDDPRGRGHQRHGNFGAFVDIGVHQDGLVHISVLSNRFVKDPREVVKAGDIVKVKVLEVDVKRRRVALSMRLDEPAGSREAQRDGRHDGRGAPRDARHDGRGARNPGRTEDARDGGVMADALKRALQRG
jgi:uncharacterized protein